MVQLLEYIVLTSASIILIYWLVILIKMASYKAKKKSPDKAVSVIVCTHNELSNLRKLVPEILKQDHSNFELIIVDDRSDDGTYDYLLTNRSDQLKMVRVDQVHDHINAKKYAITLGVKAAANDILLFTDADCIPATTDWISSMTTDFTNDTNFVLGASQYYKSKGFLGHFIRFETLLTAINYLGFALAGNPYMGIGRNLAYRKSFFLENKGFNKLQHITGGDDDLLVNHWGTKKNTKVVIGHESLIHSYPKENWKEYNTQKTRHWSVGKFYKFKDKLLLGFQNLTSLVFWSSLITLAISTDDYIIPAGVLVFRLIFVLILYHFTSKKIGDRINLWFVPVMDILYVIYASIFGIFALLTKKVRWKK